MAAQLLLARADTAAALARFRELSRTAPRDTLEWDLGDLALGASTSIIVDLRASEVGTWGNCARLYAWNLNQYEYSSTYPRWNVPPT